MILREDAGLSDPRDMGTIVTLSWGNENPIRGA